MKLPLSDRYIDVMACRLNMSKGILYVPYCNGACAEVPLEIPTEQSFSASGYRLAERKTVSDIGFLIITFSCRKDCAQHML